MFFYIDPALITIGPLSIRYYGLVYAFAFLAFYIVLLKKRHVLGLTEDQCSELLLATGLSMIFFGRLFHFLIDSPSVLLNNPLEFFAIWHGGIAFFGSVFGLIIGGLGYLRYQKKPLTKTFLQIADLSVLVGSVAIVFGRIANFINQELVGTISSQPWCVNFLIGFSEVGKPLYDPVCRHPYQIYAAISHLILFIILYLIYKKQKQQKMLTKNPGITFAWFIILYGIMRFIVDFWRNDTRLFWHITSWQCIAIVISICGYFLLRYLQKKHKEVKR